MSLQENLRKVDGVALLGAIQSIGSEVANSDGETGLIASAEPGSEGYPGIEYAIERMLDMDNAPGMAIAIALKGLVRYAETETLPTTD